MLLLTTWLYNYYFIIINAVTERDAPDGYPTFAAFERG